MKKSEVRISGKTLTGLAIICLTLGNCGKDNTPGVKPPVTPKGIGMAQAYVTAANQSKLFVKDTDIMLEQTATTTSPVIAIDSTQTFQEIDGFGAAMTGSSAIVLHALSSTTRNTVMQDLFDPVDGIGISYLRTSIGASDFSTSDYSYDDMPSGQSDYAMANFSLSVDKTDVIPMLKAAIAVSPEIKILGSPWSAPAWMKNNGSMHSTSGSNSLKSDVYDAYANYFVKYVKGMAAEGITIDALTLQNEPLYSTASYPCMSMTAVEQNSFIKNNVGPLFAAQGVSAKILVYDHNWDHPEYATTIVNDATTKTYIAGSAFHAYGGTVSAMSQVHDADPDKGLYFTEISGGDWSSDFGSNLKYFVSDIIMDATKNWSKNALLWNLALNENDGPTNNGCPDCRGVVTVSASGTVTKNVEYYSLAHFTKFVRPGAVRIASTLNGSLSNVNFVAFMNTDGTKVFVAINNTGTSQTFVVQQAARQFTYTLPAGSVVTAVWK